MLHQGMLSKSNASLNVKNSKKSASFCAIFPDWEGDTSSIKASYFHMYKYLEVL